MNRAIEIINSLRQGINSMLGEADSAQVRSLRLFNFEKRRVSLYMEASGNEEEFSPMGRIDVVEFPGSGLKSSCSCTMTELQTGKSEQLTLRLQNQEEKKLESLKVFNFFRRVMDLPELNSEQTGLEQGEAPMQDSPVNEIQTPTDNLEIPEVREPFDPVPPVSDTGMPGNSRGAQESPASD
jgi:hypothetical protein